jgi:hypothetical protein
VYPPTPGKEETFAMIKVKTFTSQLKIFHAKSELDELDKEINDFLLSNGIRKVISISDPPPRAKRGKRSD